MANALYDKGRAAILGGVDWSADNIKAVLVDTALYTVDLALDEFLSDIPVGARVATSANLASKTTTDGIADAADINFPSVSGASIEAVVLYQDTGVAATSPLLAFIDTADGLPVTPTGIDIAVQWSNAINRIFKL